jgi:hypothetical protein
MAASAAGRDAAWADKRLAALAALLPGSEDSLLRVRVGDLSRLMLLDDATLARRLVELRSALPPGVDAGRLAAQRPVLLLSATPGADAAEALAALAAALPAVAAAPGRLAALLAAEPGLLDASAVRDALDELARLAPGADAAGMLAADPSLLHQARRPAPRRDPNDECVPGVIANAIAVRKRLFVLTQRAPDTTCD